PPGVSRRRIAWLEHGYLRLESALTRLGHVVAPSHAMSDFMVSHGFPRRLVHVIPYGMELSENGPREDHDGLVAGVAANLEYWKGIDVLLEAARRMHKPLPSGIYGVGSKQARLARPAPGAPAALHRLP